MMQEPEAKTAAEPVAPAALPPAVAARPGGRLAQWRRWRRLSVAECAAAFGCSRVAWYAWEKGVKVPSPAYMAKLRRMTGGAVVPNDFYPEDAAAPEAGE